MSSTEHFDSLLCYLSFDIVMLSIYWIGNLELSETTELVYVTL